MKIKPICPEEESKEMSEQERELDVPEEVSGRGYRVPGGSVFLCQTQLTCVQFLGEPSISDFRRKVGFCPN